MPEDEKLLSPALENYLAIIFRQEFAAGPVGPATLPMLPELPAPL